VSAGEFDCGLNAFAAGAGEENFGEIAAREVAEARGQFAGEFGNVALQHDGAGAVEFVFESLNDGGMVVAGIVNAEAREEVDDAAAIGSGELSSGAAAVGDVHLEQVEELGPLRVYEIGIAVGGYCFGNWHVDNNKGAPRPK